VDASSGNAVIETGAASATGSESASDATQDLHATSGGAPVVATQTSTIVDLGAATALSGDNVAVGNTSDSAATVTQGAGSVGEVLSIDLTAADNANPGALGTTADGADVVGANGTDATATEDGAPGLPDPTVGAAPAAPVDIVVDDLGSVSDSEVDVAATSPNIVTNTGGGGNTSGGTAGIRAGRATATGNRSHNGVGQGADISAGGDPVTTQSADTSNAGVAAARSGANRATGNDSFNRATLTQGASGRGIVANAGEARNASDGSALIGNPSWPGDTAEQSAPVSGVPGQEQGQGHLPVTGGELEVQAAVALMLLLAGFALQRAGNAPDGKD
jgi:hypothetical protein